MRGTKIIVEGFLSWGREDLSKMDEFCETELRKECSNIRVGPYMNVP